MLDSQIDRLVSNASSLPGTRETVARYLRAMYADIGLDRVRPDDIHVAVGWICAEVRKGSAWLESHGADTAPEVLRGFMASSLEATNGAIEFPFVEGDEVHVKDYGDGWSLVRLATREAASRECDALGASPFTEGKFVDGDFEAGRQCLWLLRDASGDPRAMVSLNRLAICDVVAWRREPLSRELADSYIMPLVEEFGLRLMKPASIPGKVQATDGVIYDLRELPDGITIDGDLRINAACPDIEVLPDDMTVTGDLVIWSNHRLQRIPRNLHIGGGAGFAECSKLTTIGEGLHIEGFSSFRGSNALKTIEPGCVFGKGVDLPGNDELMSQRFTAGGTVRIGDAEIDPLLFAAVNGLGAGAARFASGITAMAELVKLALPQRTVKLSGTRQERYEAARQSEDDRMTALQDEMDAEIEARSEIASSPSP